MSKYLYLHLEILYYSSVISKQKKEEFFVFLFFLPTTMDLFPSIDVQNLSKNHVIYCHAEVAVKKYMLVNFIFITETAFMLGIGL